MSDPPVANRVDDLIAEGVPERFDPGHGRLMREWVHLVADDPATWRVLAAEALDFVDASTPDRKSR